MKRSTTVGLLATAVVGLSSLPMLGVAQAEPLASNVTITVSPVDPEVKQATVCWTQSSIAGPSTIVEFTVSNDQDLQQDTQNYDSLATEYCTIFGTLDTGKTYTFFVKALVDADGDSGTLGDRTIESLGTKEAIGYTLNANIVRQTIIAGGRTSISGVLREGAVGARLKGESIVVQQRLVDTTTWTKVGVSAITGDKGVWSKTLRPRFNTKYRALYTAKGMGSWTQNFDVTVKPALSIRFSANPIQLGRQIRVSGTVVKGSLVKLSGDPVCLQRKEKSGWNALRCVTIGADGKFGTRYEPGSRVDYSYRWFTGGGREYGDGTSPARVLRVN